MVSLGKGNIMYGASMSFMLMIITVAVMPLVLPSALTWMHADVHVSVWLLYWPMLLFLVLPLVVGMLVRWRHPAFAMNAATYLGPLSVVFLFVHIAMMFATYWTYFTGEFGTGDMAFTFCFGLLGLLIGYILSPPYIMSPMKAFLPQQYGRKLAAEIGTAQKGSQMLICSLIFAFGKFPVAGVMALASSVVTIIIIMAFSLERGKQQEKHLAVLAASAPAQPAPAPAAAAQSTPAVPAAGRAASTKGSPS
jgi:predicted Na+-dependent transporter